MSDKILVAAATAILLASAGLASAQTQTRNHLHAPRANGVYQPYVNSYYDRSYWESIGPNGSVGRPDPFVGTIWEGVVPY